MARKFKIGDAVRVKNSRLKSVIVNFISDIEGGVVLDRYILGFRCWNVEDLRLWKKRKKK